MAGGDTEKILGAIATCVLRPVSDSEKLVTAIEQQIAAGVTTSEWVERLNEQGITCFNAEVKSSFQAASLPERFC